MDSRTVYSSASQASVLQTNKVLRNTYMLLAMTLAFSAVCAGVAMAAGISPLTGLLLFVGGVVCMFVLNKKADSASGIYWVFAFTGLLGASLGPTLNYYAIAVSPTIITEALGATAVVFLALSGYALTTKKDFSFMGGFLVVGGVLLISLRKQRS